MPDEILEIEEREFDEALATKRHSELKGVLSDIAKLLDKPVDKSLSESIERLAEELRNQKPPEVKAPEVNVSVEQEKVVNSVEKLATDLLFELRKFNERPPVDEFRLISYGYGGKTVKVIYKKNN